MKVTDMYQAIERELQRTVNLVAKTIERDWELKGNISPRAVILSMETERPQQTCYLPKGCKEYALPPHTIIFAPYIITRQEQEFNETIIEETAHAILGRYIPNITRYGECISEQIFQEAGADCIRRMLGIQKDLNTKEYS